ncbi:hypothetical protein [Kribbella sp. VKM Ac-2568]|uniref:hypothetical protein n=1 Tax=Kribbella sp. VKM Ac-2568 TaxID=2512219 RepID=UPI00130547E6|nr:hypothetical protein [Kribbella sp. VKM Ac-2568]
MGSRVGRDSIEAMRRAAARRAGARRTKWKPAATRPTAGWAALTDAEQRVAN